jgi:hypothetical protein
MSAPLKMRNRMHLFFLCAIATAVLSDLPISVWAMLNELPTQPQKYIGYASIVGFYWIKTFKYLFLGLAVGLALVILLKNRTMNRWLLLRVIVLTGFCIGPSIMVRLFTPDIPHFLAGFKALSSLGALLVGCYLTRQNWNEIEDLLGNLLIFNIAIALMQQVYGYFACPISATGCLGITEGYRSTGTFSEPNTLGALAVAGLLISAILRFKTSPSLKITILCVITLIFSGSRTSFIAALFPLLLSYSGEKFNWNKSPFTMIFFVIFLLAGGWYLYIRGFESGLERFEILCNAMPIDEWLWGRGFGSGTQSIHSYSHMNPSLPISLENIDSLYASLWIQGGAWLLVTLGITTAYIFFKHSLLIKTTIAVFLFMGMGLVDIEVWPFNILVFSLMGWLLKENLHNEEYAR